MEKRQITAALQDADARFDVRDLRQPWNHWDANERLSRKTAPCLLSRGSMDPTRQFFEAENMVEAGDTLLPEKEATIQRATPSNISILNR
jgi:hypothetical protein